MKQIKLKVPTNWNDITIEQYQKFMVLVDSKKKEKQKMFEMIMLFCDVKKEDLRGFALADLEKISSILMKLTKDDPSNIEVKRHLDFNGAKYSLMPKMSEMTTGEFVDLENYVIDTVDNLHKIMAVLYRKQTAEVDRWGRYNVEDYEPTPDKQETMLKFPMGEALGVLNFFFHLEKELIVDSRNYLRKQTLSRIKEQNKSGE